MAQPNELYLLVNADTPSFKIGVAANTLRRAQGLPEKIAYERSYSIKLISGNAYKIERTIHYLFREHKVEKPRGDGFTEWFSIDALDAVVVFIETNKALLGVSGVEPLDLAELEELRAASRSPAEDDPDKVARRQERDLLLAEERQEDLAAATSHNAQVLAALKALCDSDQFRGVLKVKGRHDGSDLYRFFLPLPEGDERPSLIDPLGDIELNTLIASNGRGSVLVSCEAATPCPIVAYDFASFLFEPEEAQYPLFEAIHALLQSQLLEPTDADWAEANGHHQFFASQPSVFDLLAEAL